jgi:DNA-binding NarL/FixJ family response regulator
MDNITIILADDHALMREGTRHLLEQYPEFKVVGEAEDGQQALELIEQLKPDVAILDIRMPKLSGIEVVRSMKSRCPSTKALMLTAYDDDDYIFALMEAGAYGYQMKTASAKELADAVRTVYAGSPALHPAIAVKIARLWARREPSARVGTGEPLTPREMQVLELAAKGLRNKAIAHELDINLRTVEGFVNNIFVKLGVSSRVEAVLLALSRHLITPEKESKINRN